MKRRRALAVSVVVAIVGTLLAGCFTLTPVVPVVPPTPKASVIITSWNQDWHEYSEEWSDYVYVYFTVENTGQVEIDYYEVWLKVNCEGGYYYEDWTNGSDVVVGDTVHDWTMVQVNGKRVQSVEVTDFDLTSY